MQSHHDDGPVDGFPAAGSVLQNLLALIEVNNCFFMLICGNTMHPFAVQLVDVIDEFL